MRVVELDRRRIGSGAPGPITRQLSAAFRAATREENARPQAWFTPVSA